MRTHTHLLCCHCVQGLEEGLKGDLACTLGLDLQEGMQKISVVQRGAVHGSAGVGG